MNKSLVANRIYSTLGILLTLLLGGVSIAFWIVRNTYAIALKPGIPYVCIFLFFIAAHVFLLAMSRSIVVEILYMCVIFPLQTFCVFMLEQSVKNTVIAILCIAAVFLSSLAVCFVNLVRHSKKSIARAMVPGLTIVQFSPLAVMVCAIVVGMVIYAPTYRDKAVMQIASPDQSHTLLISERVGGAYAGEQDIEITENKVINLGIFECTPVPQYITRVEQDVPLTAYWVDDRTVCVNQTLYSLEG